MYDPEKISDRIKEQAKQKKKTLGDILSIYGLSVNTVTNIRNGKKISYLNLAHIADELDCSVDYLLGRTDNPEINR